MGGAGEAGGRVVLSIVKMAGIGKNKLLFLVEWILQTWLDSL